MSTVMATRLGGEVGGGSYGHTLYFKAVLIK